MRWHTTKPKSDQNCYTQINEIAKFVKMSKTYVSKVCKDALDQTEYPTEETMAVVVSHDRHNPALKTPVDKLSNSKTFINDHNCNF